MAQRIVDDFYESNDLNEVENVGDGHTAEHVVEEAFEEPVGTTGREEKDFRSGPMLALEQLVEAHEERQFSDQRKAVQKIDFADRRKIVRRSSDLQQYRPG